MLCSDRTFVSKDFFLLFYTYIIFLLYNYVQERESMVRVTPTYVMEEYKEYLTKVRRIELRFRSCLP